MKHITFFPRVRTLFLGIVGSLSLFSCGAQFSSGSEVDGVYYDPNRDSRPERIDVIPSSPRVWGYNEEEYYEELNPAEGIIAQNKLNLQERENRYRKYSSIYHPQESDWGGSYSSGWGTGYESDFGTYQGNLTRYSSPYSSGGWGLGFGGFSYPYNGWMMGMNSGFYDPFMFGGSSIWGGYSPYYSGYYSGFWGYGGMLGYPYYYTNPYYYNRGYHSGMIRPNFRASGADSFYRGNSTFGSSSTPGNFRNGYPNNSGRSYDVVPGYRTETFRRINSQNYRTPVPSQGRFRSGEGSFQRSSSESQRNFENRSWSGSSNTGGSFHSGGGSTGGFRTGRFR